MQAYMADQLPQLSSEVITIAWALQTSQKPRQEDAMLKSSSHAQLIPS